jgi:hypothetical protein
MLRATILRVDGSVLVKDVTVLGQNPKRGNGDGHIWRGRFSVPASCRRPSQGETLVLTWDNRQVAAVTTEIEGTQVHFRAPGNAPRQSLLQCRVNRGEAALPISSTSLSAERGPDWAVGLIDLHNDKV